MSPKIGIVVDVRPYAAASGRPIDRARVAVNVVESQGMRIALEGDHGVSRGFTGGWSADGRQHPRRLSLLGAICFVFQPLGGGDVVEDGAVEALETSRDWVIGLADGFRGDISVPQLAFPSRRLYEVGLRAGHLIFAEVTVECAECGERRYRRDEHCRCSAIRG